LPVLNKYETWSLTLREERRLRRIFGPKRDEVTGEWRRLNEEELHALHSSPNINWTITPRRMRWIGHVARRGHRSSAYRVSVGKLEGRNHLEDSGVYGRIILQWILQKRV
jgi:hypothetical protein